MALERQVPLGGQPHRRGIARKLIAARNRLTMGRAAAETSAAGGTI